MLIWSTSTMTEGDRIQHPSESNLNMFPSDNRCELSTTNHHVETSRSLDPRNSLEDYNRTMLEYTQRQVSSFVDQDDKSRSSGSSGSSGRSSHSSVHSGNSNTGVLAQQANGSPPTSASASRHATERARRKAAQKTAKSPGY